MEKKAAIRKPFLSKDPHIGPFVRQLNVSDTTDEERLRLIEGGESESSSSSTYSETNELYYSETVDYNRAMANPLENPLFCGLMRKAVNVELLDISISNYIFPIFGVVVSQFFTYPDSEEKPYCLKQNLWPMFVVLAIQACFVIFRNKIINLAYG